MKSHVRVTLCIAVALAFAVNMAHPTAAPAADTKQTLQELSDAFAEIASEASKMVVAVKAEQTVKHNSKGEHYWLPRVIPKGDGTYQRFYNVPDSGIQNREFRLPPEPPHFLQDFPYFEGFGSGIVLDDEGHIATAAELIGNANNITVTLGNSTHREAKLIGVDNGTGIAVIKVDHDAVTQAKIGESDQVKIGELALDLRRSVEGDLSVTLGVVSAIEHHLPVSNYNDVIKISTNLRSRSAGGAVVNTSGEVIGMGIDNTPDGAFAIPIRTVKRIAAELIEHGKVQRGWLGVRIQNVNPETTLKLGLEAPSGALIQRVLQGTPAARAGLKINDVIVAVDDDAITNVKHLRRVIEMAKPYSDVSVTVMRDRSTIEIPVTLGERTAEAVHGYVEHRIDSQTGWKGLSLQTLTESLAEAFGYETYEGVLIAGVEPHSPAAEAAAGEEKLRKGDLILEVDHQHVKNVDAFKAAVQSDKETILLRVKRGAQMWYVTVK